MYGVDNHKLSELCHIVSVRYDLQTKRQRARSKVWHYSNLFSFIFKGGHIYHTQPRKVAGYSKWKKLGRLALKAEIQKWQAAQLLAESELNILSSKTTKRVRQLTSELDAFLLYADGQNKVRAIRIDGRFLEIKDIRDLADIYAAETLLLKGEEISYV